MKSLRVMLGIACLLLATAGMALAQETDMEGSKDYPLFNRMPNFWIYNYVEHQFDSYSFIVNGTEVPVEGHYIYIDYYLQPDATPPSPLQIRRNYENAVKKIGGTVLTSDYEGSSYMKVVKDGKEIWLQVGAYYDGSYQLYIVEKEAMSQDVVADAAAMSSDIKSTGHVAVYGIYFDSGKSTLKPESEAALTEITKMLNADPSLKLYVVGHTDNDGTLDFNMSLSQDRAKAVVDNLITRGISAERLKGYGVGPLAPVAPNTTDDGKAKNRRVELVQL